MLDVATIKELANYGAPLLLFVLAAWVLKPFFANWASTHDRLTNDVNETNKKNADTNQKLAVTLEALTTGQDQTQRHLEHAHVKLDQLLQRKP